MELCDQSWNLTPELYQICNLFVSAKKFRSNLEVCNSQRFAKSGREMVMENQEMVMEKSLTNILSITV